MGEQKAEPGTTSEYVVLWFAPDGDKRKTFGDDEVKARKFAGKAAIAEWNPLLLHRVTVVVEELIPLAGDEPWARANLPGADQ